jgi:hypothetical protein
MDDMKCIKSNKTGNIIRVTDDQAIQTVGREWQYVAKSEWKSSTRVAPQQLSQEAIEAKEQVKTAKAEKAAKFKAKQRQ